MLNVPVRGQSGLGTEAKSSVTPLSKVWHIATQLLSDKGAVWMDRVEGGRRVEGEGMEGKEEGERERVEGKGRGRGRWREWRG